MYVPLGMYTKQYMSTSRLERVFGGSEKGRDVRWRETGRKSALADRESEEEKMKRTAAKSGEVISTQ